MKIKYLLIPKILTILTVLAAVVWPTSGFAVNMGEAAPEFVLKRMDGTELRHGAIKGKKPMLMVFWATWRPSCKTEIQRLKEVHAALRSKGHELIAVNVGVNDSLEKTRRYMEKYDISYPVGFDAGGRIAKRYKILGTPTIIIVDRRGVVRRRAHGVPDNLEQ